MAEIPTGSTSPVPSDMILPHGYDLNLLPEESEYIQDYLGEQSVGPLQSTPIICTGYGSAHSDPCMYIKKCPIAHLGKPLPVDMDCPIDKTLSRKWFIEFCHGLDVGESDLMEIGLVKNLVQHKILSKRAYEQLAIEPLSMKFFRGRTIDGQDMFESKLNPLVNLIDKLTRYELDVLKSFIATRESKSKDKGRTPVTADQIVSNLLERAKEAQERSRYLPPPPEDGEVIDVDPVLC